MHGIDALERAVERGPDEVVHRAVDDHELLRLRVLQEQDAREQDTGVADENAAGLEQQLDAELLDAVTEQRIRIVLRARGLFVLIGDAESAAEVEVADVEAAGAQIEDEPAYPSERIAERGDVGELRADVTIDTDDFEMGERAGALVLLGGAANVDAELRLLHSRRAVGVRLGMD